MRRLTAGSRSGAADKTFVPPGILAVLPSQPSLVGF